ncbi:hypothetical protein GPALN_011463 [Globodera pallida]|nr:hypothetical protein GPALN_011463 [Globodera pallida]
MGYRSEGRKLRRSKIRRSKTPKVEKNKNSPKVEKNNYSPKVENLKRRSSQQRRPKFSDFDKAELLAVRATYPGVRTYIGLTQRQTRTRQRVRRLLRPKSHSIWIGHLKSISCFMAATTASLKTSLETHHHTQFTKSPTSSTRTLSNAVSSWTPN